MCVKQPPEDNSMRIQQVEMPAPKREPVREPMRMPGRDRPGVRKPMPKRDRPGPAPKPVPQPLPNRNKRGI